MVYLPSFFKGTNIFSPFSRFKYLEKMHEEEMNKILVYLKGFSDEDRRRLAQVRNLLFGWISFCIMMKVFVERRFQCR